MQAIASIHYELVPFYYEKLVYKSLLKSICHYSFQGCEMNIAVHSQNEQLYDGTFKMAQLRRKGCKTLRVARP